MTSLDSRSPLVIDTHELGRRPGNQREVSASVPAPPDLGIEVLRVASGSPIEIDLRLEAVMEGVLLTGSAYAVAAGECVRCLEPVTEQVEVDIQELFVYDDKSDFRADDDVADDVSRLEGDLIDLEPLVREAIVLALPFQPLCREDCLGLCAECGVNLASSPGHTHETLVDPRWAALAQLHDQKLHSE